MRTPAQKVKKKKSPATSAAARGDIVINVPPSNRIFEELGNTTYDLLDAVSELVDNAIAAAPAKGPFNVTVTFSYSQTQKASDTFEIVDDCSGISRDNLGNAVSPALLSGNSLN